MKKLVKGKEDTKKERFYVGEVATQTENVIVDGDAEDEDVKQYNIYTAMSHMMNKLDRLEKLLK